MWKKVIVNNVPLVKAIVLSTAHISLHACGNPVVQLLLAQDVITASLRTHKYLVHFSKKRKWSKELRKYVQVSEKGPLYEAPYLV